MLRLAAILCFPLTLSLVGCEHVKTHAIAYTDDGEYLPLAGGEGLVADPQSPIPDVPMPVGYRPVPSHSSSSFDGRVRKVMHVYQGRGELADIESFYRRHLPYHGWSFVSRTNNNDGSLVQYWTKGREALQIHAVDEKFIQRVNSSVTTITLHIGPRGS